MDLKYLNYEGLKYFYNKIKARLEQKADASRVTTLESAVDQVNSDLGSVSEAIPSPFRVRLVGNSRGALICPDDGIYLLLAGCRHNSAVYMEAIVSKHPNVNDGAPKVTILKSAGMSVEATNSGGTIAVIATGVEDSLVRMCSIQFGGIV